MAENFPKKALFCECFCRDGQQNRPEFVPTAMKIEKVDRCTEIGFPLIEVTSFAHPKYLPQFSDAREVLAGITREKGGVHYIALVPNETGAGLPPAVLRGEGRADGRDGHHCRERGLLTEKRAQECG